MMVEDSWEDGRTRSYYNRGNNSHESALFQDDTNHNMVKTSLLEHNLMQQRSSPHHQQYIDKYYDDYDDVQSLLSFQNIKNQQDYDRLSYARKTSRTNGREVRTSSPDRGGGGGGADNYEGGGYYTYDDKKYTKVYDNEWQSRSRRSRRSDESSISYIDYNDSFKDNGRQRYNGGRSRSHSPSISVDERVGSTIRTDFGADSAATSITFSEYNRSKSHRRQHQQRLVGYTRPQTNEDGSIMSKPQVISVPSPVAKKSALVNYRSGRDMKKPPYSSSVHVHEMGSRRQVSKRRSTSKSKSSTRNINRNDSRTRSRSGSTSKRSRSSDDKSTDMRRQRSSGSRSTKSSKSRRSRDSSISSISGSNGKTKSRSRSLNDKHHNRRGDLKRERSSRHLESNDDIDHRSAKSSDSDRDRLLRDRRREMMTGRATAHLLDDDTKSTYSHLSVRHDVDDEGYCQHHPEIELMRLRPDGFWSTVRKKCPECIYEDCPNLMGDVGFDEEDGNSEETKLDDSAAARAILNSSRLFSFHNIMAPEDIEKEEELNRLKRRLAARAYHFPGNSWCEDWMQFLSNTHTVLGLFFHHPLHPLKLQERLVILFGSIAIGLTISNMTYLYFIHNDLGADDVVFTLNARHSKYTGIPEINVTKVMITLWTLGSFLHTVFDLSLWHMKACTLCRYGGLVDEKLARMGRLVGLFIVLVVMGVGGYAVLLRATMEYKGEGSISDEVVESIKNNEIYDLDVEDKRSFRFLLGYLVEFILALFVYYPIAVTILFSGVLGCNGRVPLLGGRPREMKKELLHLQKKNESTILRTPPKRDGSGGADDAASYGREDSFDYFDENQVM